MTVSITQTGFSALRRWVDRLGWQGARCVFILSTGRTGTVTVCHLLETAPGVEAHHEPRPGLLEHYRDSFGQATVRPGHYWSLFASARRSLIGRCHRRGRVYVEATVLKFFAPVIASRMPRARFVHLHRNGADVVRSGMRRGWYDGHGYDAYKLLPDQDDPAHDAWPGWGPFEKNCWMWATENAWFMDLAETLEPGRVLTMSSEALLDPQTGEAERLFEFVGVEPPAAEMIRDVLAVRRNEQTVGDFPPPERWTDEQRGRFDAIAGPVMRRLGYAPAGVIEAQVSEPHTQRALAC